jgi:hypothetical protein
MQAMPDVVWAASDHDARGRLVKSSLEGINVFEIPAEWGLAPSIADILRAHLRRRIRNQAGRFG